MSRETHLSDQELLMAVDGELAPSDSRRAESHLEACWSCRARRQEIELAIGEFIRFQRESPNTHLPPADGSRALLKAQLSRLADQQQHVSPWHRLGTQRAGWAVMATIVLIVAGFVGYAAFRAAQGSAVRSAEVTVPNPSFTPGATVLFSRQQVCRETSANNKAVPKAIQRRVFDQYGIRISDAGAYEVDYLITPALGGADDIRNLWPESNRAKVWNSLVKDQLEQNLRGLVCGGQLDLATAQRELAGGWIQAYKRRFHTDQPLQSNP